MTADLELDTLKIAVVNRHQDLQPAIAFSVVHDSHNIVAVGTTEMVIL